MTEEKIREVVERFAEEAKKIYGVRLQSIILYGSCACGDFEKDSDIDILVLLEVSQFGLRCCAGTCISKLCFVSEVYSSIFFLPECRKGGCKDCLNLIYYKKNMRVIDRQQLCILGYLSHNEPDYSDMLIASKSDTEEQINNAEYVF